MMGAYGVVCRGDEGVCLTERGGGEQAIAGDENAGGESGRRTGRGFRPLDNKEEMTM